MGIAFHRVLDIGASPQLACCPRVLEVERGSFVAVPLSCPQGCALLEKSHWLLEVLPSSYPAFPLPVAEIAVGAGL